MKPVFRTNIPGHNGGTVISTTAATTPVAGKVFVELRVITTTVISAITGNLTGLAGLVGATLEPGTSIPGRITSVTLTSGIVVAVED